MACTIRIIRRAVTLRGVSWAKTLQSPSTFGSTWQSVQLKLVDAAMNPIVSMNSSTGIPLSTVTFLKACSDISCFAGAVWQTAGTVFSKQRAIAPTTGPHPSFIIVSLSEFWYWISLKLLILRRSFYMIDDQKLRG